MHGRMEGRSRSGHRPPVNLPLNQFDPFFKIRLSQCCWVVAKDYQRKLCPIKTSDYKRRIYKAGRVPSLEVTFLIMGKEILPLCLIFSAFY
jgi:hypothetical protein